MATSLWLGLCIHHANQVRSAPTSKVVLITLSSYFAGRRYRTRRLLPTAPIARPDPAHPGLRDAACQVVDKVSEPCGVGENAGIACGGQMPSQLSQLSRHAEGLIPGNDCTSEPAADRPEPNFRQYFTRFFLKLEDMRTSVNITEFKTREIYRTDPILKSAFGLKGKVAEPDQIPLEPTNRVEHPNPAATSAEGPNRFGCEAAKMIDYIDKGPFAKV